MSDEDTLALFEDLAKGDPQELLNATRLLKQERDDLARAFAKEKVAKARALAVANDAKRRLEEAMTPPLHPAMVLRRLANDRLDVVARGGRQIVGMLPELAEATLRVGDEVWIDGATGVVVSRGEAPLQIGSVATVSEHMGDRLVVRSEGDEDTLVLCEPELAARIEVGDRVLYRGDFPCVQERLPRRSDETWLLKEAPPTRFDDIGGLDELIEEVRSELDMHLFQPELVSQYRMKLMRGMTLVGPPGVGKTMFAAAVARHLADVAPETRFMDVAPGSLRGQYYGQTEQRIRELFSAARSAPGLVVMFFDELDNFGARGSNAAHEIDDRVLGTLLAAVNGLVALDNVFVIGATNRLELIDAAMVRQGRFGDRIVEIDRPNREGASGILRRLLAEDLPWEGRPDEAADAAVTAASSFLFAPNGGAGPVVRLTFADGTQQDVRAPQILSGALLASSVERAKKAAAHRELQGGARLLAEDVTFAIDRALGDEARKLSAVSVARRTLTLPRANEITRVEVPAERHLGAFSRLRAA